MRRALLLALVLVLAAPAAPAWADHGHRHRHGQHQGGDEGGCSKQSCNHPGRHCEGSQDCSTKIGPVFICTVPQSCPQPKALFPPTPAKIVALIQTIFTDTQTFIFGILKVVA